MIPYRRASTAAAMLVAGAACASFAGFAAAQTGAPGTSALLFAPPALTVQQGGTATVNVTVDLRGGQAAGTALKAWDMPSGMAIAFQPPSGNPKFTATMSVAVSPTVKPGPYTVKLQATGGNPSDVVSYVITVEKSGGY
jgi:hypothetical protein